MNFKSDNWAPVNAEIVQSIVAANYGMSSAYGNDDYTLLLQKKLSEIFEKEVLVYLTSTGTAANSLALAALVKPYGSIYCHTQAHINTSECGAVEFYTGGAKLIPIDGENSKIDRALLQAQILSSQAARPLVHKPGCISITQVTEHGTVYTLQELKDLQHLAQKHNLPMHMDGARFANALVTLGCKPADMTWKVGIDVMSFGATKNGALSAEAVVFFNHAYAEDFDYMHKRAGQVASKGRFFACQFLASLNDGLWLKNAQHANDMAQKLACVFRNNGVSIRYPVQANELFVGLSPARVEYLIQHNCGFYEWDEQSNLYRFVTSFFTTDADITTFEDCLSNASDKTFMI